MEIINRFEILGKGFREIKADFLTGSEYLMIYRWLGLVAVAWFGSSPTPFPSPPVVSKMSLFLSLPVCGRRAYWRERWVGDGWGRSEVILQRESLVFYNLSIFSEYRESWLCFSRTVRLWVSAIAGLKWLCPDFFMARLLINTNSRNSLNKRYGEHHLPAVYRINSPQLTKTKSQ